MLKKFSCTSIIAALAAWLFLPEAGAQNIAANGSFEQGKKHWGIWSPGNTAKTVFTVDGKKFRSGRMSAEITAVDTKDRAFLVSYADLAGGKRYKAAFWYCSQDLELSVPGSIRLSFYFMKKDKGYGSAGTKSFPVRFKGGNEDWKRFSTVFTVPKGTVKARFSLVFSNIKGSVRIDDFRIEKLPPRIPGAVLRLDRIIDSAKIISSDPKVAKAVIDSKLSRKTGKSLRIDIDKSLDNLDFKGVYDKPTTACIWIKIPENVNLNDFTELSYYLKIKGGRHAYIKLGFADEPEPGRLQGVSCPIDSGDWRRYTYPLGYGNICGPQYLGIRVYNILGHNVDEPAKQSIYIDDLRLTDKPLRCSKGWSVDPTVIAVSQAGFSPHKDKLAVVNAKYVGKPFKIVDNDGKTCFTGTVKSEKSFIGTTGIIDFTRLQRPGTYRIISGFIKSPRFDINTNACDKCIALVSDWVGDMRCGCKTALHAPCHLDDGYLPYLDKQGNITSRKHYDFSGGWHDAGDIRTYYFYSFTMARWLLPALAAGWNRDRDGDGIEDYYDYARWAMRHLLKIRDPRDGRFLVKAADRSFLKGAPMDFRFGNYWTDNISGTHDDRYVTPSDRHKWIVNSTAMGIESIARFATAAKPADKALAAELLKIARERWNYWFDPAGGKLFTAEYPLYQRWQGVFAGHNIRNLGWYGSASLALYIADGEKGKKYYDFAMKCAAKILESQNREFSDRGEITGDVFVTGARQMKNLYAPEQSKYVCENFIAELMRYFPEHEMYYKWRAFLLISSRWWMKSIRAKTAPFSVPHAEVKKEHMLKNDFGFSVNSGGNKKYDYIIPWASSFNVGNTAYHMWNIAAALNDIELENSALRQLQWMTGFNPFGVSFICDYGEDCLDQFYSFSQGIMPGQIGTSAGMGKYTGVMEKGIPGVIRPQGSESHTKAGAVFCQALSVLSRPAKLRLRVVNSNSAYRGKVSIIWPKAGSVVFQGLTDEQGGLEELCLDGGQKYQVKIGPVTVPLKLVSGTGVSMTINLDRLINISARAPAVVKPGKTFEVILSASNPGRQEVSAEITAFAESAGSGKKSVTLKLKAGETKETSWTFQAGGKPGPYVISFRENRKGSRITDVCGRIQP